MLLDDKRRVLGLMMVCFFVLSLKRDERTNNIGRQKRQSFWDSTIKTDQERNKALYTYYKSQKTDVEDFLYGRRFFRVVIKRRYEKHNREQKKRTARMSKMLDDD